jgi:septum formation inhibitor-activating ATPase MinD
VLNADGSQSIVLDEDCVTAEEIELILETMDAASFNFIASDVPQGIHTISVQARVDTTGSQIAGTFEAKATVGKGSMTVESVRLIKGEDVVDVP